MPDTDKWTPHLDDLSAREDGDESWARRDRQAAVDWFKREIHIAQIEHARANAQLLGKPRERQCHVKKSGVMVNVPLDIAEMVEASLRIAPDGKKPRRSLKDRKRRAAEVGRARRRKAELMAHGMTEAELMAKGCSPAEARSKSGQPMNASDAEAEAAQEARDHLLKYDIDLAVDTIQREMQDR
jgi:hypothetical protein